jgi:peptidoglycan hydrolase CwlO-like protein
MKNNSLWLRLQNKKLILSVVLSVSIGFSNISAFSYYDNETEEYLEDLKDDIESQQEDIYNIYKEQRQIQNQIDLQNWLIRQERRDNWDK